MMEKGKSISSGFLITASILVISLAGYFYMGEKKFVENSMTMASTISDISSEPRKRVLRIRAEDVGLSSPILSVTVPFWDTREVGEQIRVRISNGTAPQVKVDELIYLHVASISILTGYSVLLGIFLFRKKTRYS